MVRTWSRKVVSARPGKPSVWGHRGASKAALQNSPEAFELAREQGADGVELDIRRTADGVLVVHHDADLTDGRNIIDCAAGELPDYVPTLGWVLDLYADATVNIEVKSVTSEPDFDPAYPVVDLLLAVLDAHDETGRHIVTSFDAEVINRIRSAAPERPTGLITYAVNAVDGFGELAEQGHVAVMVSRHLADKELVKQAQNHDLFVGVWTVNDPEDMKRLARLGVDAVMTDLPDVAVELYS